MASVASASEHCFRVWRESRTQHHAEAAGDFLEPEPQLRQLRSLPARAPLPHLVARKLFLSQLKQITM